MHQFCPFKSLLDRFEGNEWPNEQRNGGTSYFPLSCFQLETILWLAASPGRLHSGPQSPEKWKLYHGVVSRPVAETENNSKGL